MALHPCPLAIMLPCLNRIVLSTIGRIECSEVRAVLPMAPSVQLPQLVEIESLRPSAKVMLRRR